MDGIKIAASKFEQMIRHTSDHIYYGIVKREFWDKKLTKTEWFDLLTSIKSRPAK